MAPADPPGIPSRLRSLPRVEREEVAKQPASAAPPSARKPSPADGIRVQGHGWGLTVPAVVVSAIVTTLVGRLTEKAPTLAPDDELRRDVKELRSEIREIREENRQLRGYVRAQATWTEQSIGLTAQVVQRLGGKLDFAPGSEPPPVEFHAPPLRAGAGKAAQPKAVLAAPPELPP